MELFGGKWNFRIICVLAALGTLRYSELRREMGNITDAVLATTLNRGIIERLPEINQMTVKYMKQASSESSKTRRITLISAPTNE